MDRDSPIPYYYQLKEGLRDQIHRGILRPGDRLPPESQLTESYGVSVITIRRAMRDLADEGLVVRERGRGTYVTSPPPRFDVAFLRTFTEEMRRRGVEPGAKVLSAGVEKASAEVAKDLDVPEGASVVHIRRLRLASGEPVGVESNYLPEARVPGLLEMDLTGSLYGLLSQHFGLLAAETVMDLHSVLLRGEDARLLELRGPAAGLRVRGVTVDETGRRIDAVRCTYLGERYGLTAHVQRSSR